MSHPWAFHEAPTPQALPPFEEATGHFKNFLEWGPLPFQELFEILEMALEFSKFLKRDPPISRAFEILEIIEMVFEIFEILEMGPPPISSIPKQINNHFKNF